MFLLLLFSKQSLFCLITYHALTYPPYLCTIICSFVRNLDDFSPNEQRSSNQEIRVNIGADR